MERQEALSKRLKEICEEKNISYAQLAKKCGMSVRVVYRLYNGMTSNPSIYTMITICDALDISLDDFFCSEEFRK